jgi:hypothetical protein
MFGGFYFGQGYFGQPSPIILVVTEPGQVIVAIFRTYQFDAVARQTTWISQPTTAERNNIQMAKRKRSWVSAQRTLELSAEG